VTITQKKTETRPNPLGRSVLNSGERVVAAATVPVCLYLLFVLHYSLNVPLADDWLIVPLVKAAHHGQLPLWSQYGERRLVVGRAIIIGFGLFDHLNEQHVMLFTALVFIASYVIFLTMLKSYRKLTWPLVLVTGVVWFTLTDWQNALWSFQLSWYLVVFFFIVMTALLLKNRPVLFSLSSLLSLGRCRTSQG